MEKRISKKVDHYITEFKNEIKEWCMSKGINMINKDNENLLSEFLQYIYDYDSLKLCEEDFKKRKRVKNVVPHFERCIGLRANGEQCTRRKKEGHTFCGTHVKGTPHGTIDNQNNNNPSHQNIKKVEVWVQEIQGISYYIDAYCNVYRPEDIISNSLRPNVINKYRIENGQYVIPDVK